MKKFLYSPSQYFPLFALLFMCVLQCETIVVQTKQGNIRGHEGESRRGRKFSTFLGIPYGAVKNRFEEASPAPGWSGTLNASCYGTDCVTSEDCLFLNVFTPRLNDSRLPVLFWIHGGAFQFGSGSSFGPEYFMDEDVVIVTINYRLGITGFFNLDVDGAPGNQGLKDMILALKWTQENIEAFNGDKGRVTIFGESAGGAAVSFLILSPLSRGLFHSGISQSGTALCPWAFDPNVKVTSFHVAEGLGCTGLELEVLKCMRNLTLEQINGVERRGILPASFVNPMSFVPTIERRTPGPNSTIFLCKSPLEMGLSGQFTDVPYILGINKYEAGVGNALLNWFSNETVRDWIPVFAPRALGYLDRPDAWNISHAIQELYFKSPSDSEAVISKLITDRTFLAPTRLTALLHSKRSPAYLYSFDKPGTSALVPFLTLNTPQHTDELAYLWILAKPPFYGSHLILPSSSNFNFSEAFVKSWVEFARTGQPSWNGDARRWRSFTDGNPIWFHIDDTVATKTENSLFARKMDFWSRL